MSKGFECHLRPTALLEPHVSVSYSELSQLHFYQWGKSRCSPTLGSQKRYNTISSLKWKKISSLTLQKVKTHCARSFLAFRSEKGFCVFFSCISIEAWSMRGIRELGLLAVTFNLSLSTHPNDFSWKWDGAGTDSRFCCGCGDSICCENSKTTFSVLNVIWFAFRLSVSYKERNEYSLHTIIF